MRHITQLGEVGENVKSSVTGKKTETTGVQRGQDVPYAQQQVSR